MRRSGGFTFIELVVALVIASVIAAIAAPSLVRFQRGVRLDSAARQVKGFIDYGRALALRESSTIVVRMEPATGELSLWRPVDNDPEGGLEPTGAPGVHRLDRSIAIDVVEIDSIRVPAGGLAEVTLWPMHVESELRVYLSDQAGDDRVVEMRPGSGRVRVR